MTGNCSFCFQWSELDRDHIKSRGSGGKDEDWNIWLLCRQCHIKKHAKGLKWITEKYPHTKKLLSDRGYTLEFILGRYRLVREKKDD